MDQIEKRFEVSRWIAEDFAGVIGEEEKRMLDAWREESPEHEEEYRELLTDFREGKEKAFSEEGMVAGQWKRFAALHLQRRRMIRRWMQVAALFMLFLGVAGVWFWQSHGVEPKVVSERIQVAEGNVRLILSDGKTVNLQKDSVRVVKDGSDAEIKVDGETISYLKEVPKVIGEAFNTLIIPKGGEYKIVLADGSRVWLNSETEFRYPVHFTGDFRKVYLKGEAYFEVARQETMPFIVETSGGIDVRVLGTRFNVASYENDADVVTTLAEGSVEVYTDEKVMRIRPDEQVLVHKSSGVFERRQVDAATDLAWKDGKIIFEDQTLEQIIRQLQRWYQMDVFYSSEAVKQYRFSGDLKKYDDFGKIVEMIEEVAGLQISIKNNCVIIGAK